MLNKSIAYRLSVFISLAVVAVFLVFIAITFYFNTGIVKNNIESQAEELSAETIGLIERQLVSTREIATNISGQIMFFAQNNSMEVLISKIMERYPFVNAVHVHINDSIAGVTNHYLIAFRDQDSVEIRKANQRIRHCAAEEAMYTTIPQDNTFGWTQIFECEKNKTLAIAYYVPIFSDDESDGDNAIGQVFCEVSLSNLNNDINQLKMGKDGYAFVIDRAGTYITHPKKEWIFNRNILDLPKKQYKANQLNIPEVLKKGQAGTSVGYPEYLNGKKSWVYYTPVRETGWFLIFIMPYNELFVPLYILVLRMLFFSVLGILIIFFIITYITNKMIEPLTTVTNQLQKFSTFTEEAEINTSDEIRQVSASLDALRMWHKKFKISQHQVEKINQQRMQDLLEASEIQMSLINTDFSAIDKRDDLDLYAIYKPSRIVSGDLFDFFFIDEDHLFFAIGDVSGDGVPAAFYMTVAQTLIRKHAKFKNPATVVNNVNNELYTTNEHQFFLTLFVGVLNLKNGVLRYCNAAHTTSILVKTDGDLLELEQSHGMPLGLYPNKAYKVSGTVLQKNDILFLYTDGVTDLQNEEKKQFGYPVLLEKLTSCGNKDPKTVIGHIEHELEAFKMTAKQVDDITILAVKYNGTKKA